MIKDKFDILLLDDIVDNDLIQMIFYQVIQKYF